MTPFMLQVSEVLGLPADIDMPHIRSSRALPAAVGADSHIECRSLAEQLVCEANAVLASNAGDRVSLTDELSPGMLAFCLTYRDRQARIVTTIGNDVAVGHLYGVGARHLADVELTGPDQLEHLILALIATDRAAVLGSGVPAPGTLAL